MLKRRRKELRQFKIDRRPLDRTEPFVGFKRAERRTPRVMARRAHFARQSLQDCHVLPVFGDGTHPFRQIVFVEVSGESLLPLFGFHLLLVKRRWN